MIARDIGEGRPLVLVHGFELDHRIMLPLEQALNGTPWRRIYLDLPWVLQEGSVRGSADAVAGSQDVADTVVAELRDYLGDEPFAIIGNSFGGMIARYVAHKLRSQVLGLATLAAVFTARHEDRDLPPRQVLVRDPALGAAPEDFLALAVVQTRQALAAFNQYILPGLQAGDQAVLKRIAADYSLSREPEAEFPEAFDAPSLHIFGRQDHVTGYNDGVALREHYVRGTFAVLDSAGHNVHLERPAVVSALLRDWLAGVESYAAGAYEGCVPERSGDS